MGIAADNGPAALFEAARDNAGEDTNVVLTAIAVALSELVTAAYGIKDQLTRVADTLEHAER